MDRRRPEEEEGSSLTILSFDVFFEPSRVLVCTILIMKIEWLLELSWFMLVDPIALFVAPKASTLRTSASLWMPNSEAPSTKCSPLVRWRTLRALLSADRRHRTFSASNGAARAGEMMSCCAAR